MNIEDCILEVMLNTLADDESVNVILNNMTDGMSKEQMQKIITEIDSTK